MKGIGFRMQFCLSVELRKLLLANELRGGFGKQKAVRGPVLLVTLIWNRL